MNADMNVDNSSQGSEESKSQFWYGFNFWWIVIR